MESRYMISDDTSTQIYGRHYEGAGSNEYAKEGAGEIKSAIHQAGPEINNSSPTRLNYVPETRHGADVLCVLDRARDWAATERHALVTIDHFLFALTQRGIGASALHAMGVATVSDLEVELLNAVHKMPVAALGDGETSTVDDAVLAILNHALGFARRNGRDSSSLDDLLKALFDALRGSEQDTPGMAALRKRWPQAHPNDPYGEFLLQIKENQANQTSIITRTAIELAALRERIPMPETRQIGEIGPRSLPWYQRLNLLLLSMFAAVIISVASALLWTGG
jgi:hypothetical protein